MLTLIDGEGFEPGATNPSSYDTTFLNTGQLEGQFASTFDGFVDDLQLYAGDFEFLGADQFTDADIMAIAAGGDPGSRAAFGTSYIDNYLVIENGDLSKIPEISTLILDRWGSFFLAWLQSLK